MLVCLANSKGGVGKSTLAVHLAVWLHDRGFQTAFLDCDPQASSKQWLAESEPRIEVETAITPEDVAVKGQGLAREANWVVVDTPGSIHDVSRTAMLLAHLAVFPVGPSILDLRSVSQATTVLKYAQTINGGRPIGRLVLNRIRTRDTISRDLIAAAPSLGLEVCASTVRDLKVFRDAAQQGTVVQRMGNLAADAARELDALFAELTAELLTERDLLQTMEDNDKQSTHTDKRT